MRRSLVALLLVAVLTAPSAFAGRHRAVMHPSPAPAPVAVADSYSVAQGTTLTVEAPGVLANDTLSGGAIEESSLGTNIATANGGTLTLAASGGFVYTAAASFAGTDAFHYVIRNARGNASATVTIEVTSTPVAANGDSYTTEPDRALSVPAPGVLTNDFLGTGANIIAFGKLGTETPVDASATTANGGSIMLSRDGSFRYSTPPREDDGYGSSRPFIGTDEFMYTIQSGSVTSSAKVSIEVEVPAGGADFVVTTPGMYYAISGLSGQNPVLQLTRGKTYHFRISADASHPFAIMDAPVGSVINNNITSGILTFTVPLAAQNYRYRCTTHGFGNVIATVP